jgi:FkbM family methyltransferase
VVFDVGAHMGFFTVKIARQVNTVVAFEPDPYNYHFLLTNIERNQLSNVLALNCALGEKDGSSFLKGDYGHGRTRLTGTNTGQKVTVRSLDSLVSELKLRPSVVKIDTEGYEHNVLQGAQSALISSKPRLLVASYHYPGEAQEIVRYLTDRTYCCYVYDVPLALQKVRETYVYAEPLNGSCPSK